MSPFTSSKVTYALPSRASLTLGGVIRLFGCHRAELRGHTSRISAWVARTINQRMGYRIFAREKHHWNVPGLFGRASRWIIHSDHSNMVSCQIRDHFRR
jgi:hypothetical protein